MKLGTPSLGEAPKRDVSSTGSLNKKNTTVWACVTPMKLDIISILLLLVMVVVTTVISVVTHHVSRQQQQLEYQFNLDKSALEVSNKLNSALSSITTKMSDLTMLYSIKENVVQQEKEFTPFVEIDNKLPSYVSRVFYCTYVEKANANAFVNSMRARGGQYANYTIMKRNPQTQILEPSDLSAPFYVVNTNHAPDIAQTRSISGYDHYSALDRMPIIDMAIKTGKPTASQQLASASNSPTSASLYGSQQYQPVYSLDKKTLYGFSVFVFETSAIISYALTGTELDMHATEMSFLPSGIKLYPDLAPEPYKNATRMYSSFQFNGTFTRDGIPDDVRRLDEMKYKSTVVIPFATRYWQLTYTPKNIPTDDVKNYIGTIVSESSLVAGLLLCFILSLAFRFRRFTNERNKSREYYKVLKSMCKKLEEASEKTLIKIKSSECALDSVGDVVLIVDANGVIVDHNERFSKLFTNVNQDKIENKFCVSSLFIDEEPLFYAKPDVKKGTRVLTGDGSIFVTVSTRKINDEGADSPMVLITMNAPSYEEVGPPEYVITMNFSEKEEKYRKLSQIDFVNSFINGDAITRANMLNFFQHSDVVQARLQIILMIADYKKLDSQQRSSRHTEIMNFLKNKSFAIPQTILEHLDRASVTHKGGELFFDELNDILTLYVVSEDYVDFRTHTNCI
ncbi:tri [Acrasis kona]|uniref:Tri n=1 Tax=Acrasis kona TaxID=1008807 RepID=A0AAW2Z6U7_9EUKA